MPIMREDESYQEWRVRVEETPETYAMQAYVSYMHYTGGLTFDGRAMPAWADLTEPIQNAWRAAITGSYDRACEDMY